MQRVLCVLIALMLFSVMAMAESEVAEDWPAPDESEQSWNEEEESVGEWEITELNQAKVGDSLRGTFEKAVSEMGGVTYTPIGVLGTQTASGTNYCILCHCAYEATESGETGWCLVYLSESLDGSAEVTNVVNLDIDDLSDYGIFH